jgi:chromosome segregation ATPase
MNPAFSKSEQHTFRQVFILECRQKAWGATCNAAWISKELDTLVAQYEELAAEDHKHEEEIKTLENAVDQHTVENRNKRKALRERREVLKGVTSALAANVKQAQQAMVNLRQSAETNLALASYAAEWEWNKPEAENPAA